MIKRGDTSFTTRQTVAKSRTSPLRWIVAVATIGVSMVTMAASDRYDHDDDERERQI